MQPLQRKPSGSPFALFSGRDDGPGEAKKLLESELSTGPRQLRSSIRSSTGKRAAPLLNPLRRGLSAVPGHLRLDSLLASDSCGTPGHTQPLPG